MCSKLFKNLLLFLILVLNNGFAQAQMQGWQWAKRTSNGQGTLGHYYTLTTKEITMDLAGNVYMAALIGDTNLSIDHIPLINRGKANGLLSSFSCDGHYRWSKVFGSPNDSVDLVSIKTDSLGNVYLCGIMNLKSSSGLSVNGYIDTDTTIIGNSYRKIFIAKWDSSGNFKWLRMPQPDTIGFLNSFRYNSVIGMAVTADGTVHLACYLSPGGYAGYRMNVNTGGAYVIRYDANGNYISNTRLEAQDISTNFGQPQGFRWLPMRYKYFKYDPINLRYLIYGQLLQERIQIGNKIKEVSFSSLGKAGFVASFNATNGKVAFVKYSSSSIGVADTNISVNDLALDNSGNIYLSGDAQSGSNFNGLNFGNPTHHWSTFYMKLDGKTGDTLWTLKGQNTKYFDPVSIVYPLKYALTVSNGVVSTCGQYNDSLNFPNLSIHDSRFNDTPSLYLLQLNATTGAINQASVIPSISSINTAITHDQRGNIYFSGTSFDSIQFANPNNPAATTFHLNGTLYLDYYFYLAKWGVPSCSCSPPKANFTEGASSSKTVVYTYSGSTLGLDSLVWDWGDGHSSTVISGFSTPIVHTYPSTGKQYQVCVNVYGFCGSGQYCDLSAPVSVNSALCTASGALLYPNPAQDLVYLSNAEGAELSIQNYLGQILQRFIITSKKEQIKIHDLAAGIYLMQIKHADGRRELLRWRKE